MQQLSLARTKVALAAYDEARQRFLSSVGSHDPVEVTDGLYAKLVTAESRVGEVFAEDTADRNDPATARRQLPCEWLRGLVAKYG